MFTSDPPNRRDSGATLVEFLMAVGLSGIIAGALLILAVSTGRSIAEMVNYVDLDHHNRLALDNMTREVRQVRTITALTSNSVTFLDKNGTTVRYSYSPSDRALSRISGGTTQTLIDQCDRLNFAAYQRTPASNTYNLISTSTITNTKAITVTWSCSRRTFGFRANTEQGQTAKIVIRNKKEL
jgi:Tfp pilus assembly protein PilW